MEMTMPILAHVELEELVVVHTLPYAYGIHQIKDFHNQSCSYRYMF